MKKVNIMKLSGILLPVVLIALSACFFSCSHKNPYYRSGASELDQRVMQASNLIERLILIGDAGETHFSLGITAGLDGIVSLLRPDL